MVREKEFELLQTETVNKICDVEENYEIQLEYELPNNRGDKIGIQKTIKKQLNRKENKKKQNKREKQQLIYLNDDLRNQEKLLTPIANLDAFDLCLEAGSRLENGAEDRNPPVCSRLASEDPSSTSINQQSSIAIASSPRMLAGTLTATMYPHPPDGSLYPIHDTNTTAPDSYLSNNPFLQQQRLGVTPLGDTSQSIQKKIESHISYFENQTSNDQK